MIHEMDAQEWAEALEIGYGFCRHCRELSGDGLEPDAEGVACDHCGRHDVVGLESALLEGLVEVTDQVNTTIYD